MPIELTDASRAAFEAWAKSPPFEWDTARYPDDPQHYKWPGGYRSHVTLCGWEAWQAGFAAGIERAAQKCDEYDVPQRTYASENTDHYRGFRAGAVRCATEIRGLLK